MYREKRDEVRELVKQEIAEFSGGEHSIDSHMHDLIAALRLQNAITQRLLQKFEEAYGLPKGDPFSFAQASPAQNTGYTSQPIAYDGIIRSLLLAGPGNVTLKLNIAQAINGVQTICQLPCQGAGLAVPHHIRVPAGGTFTLSTDSNAGTGLLSMSAWIEPIATNGQEYFRLRR